MDLELMSGFAVHLDDYFFYFYWINILRSDFFLRINSYCLAANWLLILLLFLLHLLIANYNF